MSIPPFKSFVLQVPYLNPIFDPNFDPLSPCEYCMINFLSLYLSLLLQLAFPAKIRLATASPHFSMQVPFCAHCQFLKFISLQLLSAVKYNSPP